MKSCLFLGSWQGQRAELEILPAKRPAKKVGQFPAAVSVLLLSSLLLGGCASPQSTASADLPATEPLAGMPTLRLTKQATVPIGSVGANEGDQAVTISGTVAKRVAVLGGWLYQVSDDSGSLWVLTTVSNPAVGQLATVEGIIRYEAISVGEIDAGDVYLEESTYFGEQSDAPTGSEVEDQSAPF